MDSIFHEKQEGYLCAQHCLNALLQGPYFNAVDLANIGHQMDEEERIRMAESGIDSEDYKLFLEQPSGNMDDSGYFSVQVISSALKALGLELIPYNSTEPTAVLAQNDPSQMKAYICNYKGHWFTIRKLGRQWFNLNSMLSGPQLVSDTYLAMYLAQLLQEGYSIFIVIGTFPQCPAEEILLKSPVVISPKPKPAAQTEVKSESKGYRLGTKAEDEILKAALALREVEVPNSSYTPTTSASLKVPYSHYTLHRDHIDVSKVHTSEDRPRERIIPITLEGERKENKNSEELQKAAQLNFLDEGEDINKTLKLRLDLRTDTKDAQTLHIANDVADDDDDDDDNDDDNDDDDDDELRRALQLSLECVTAPPTPDPEDLRWRRLTHFGIYSGGSGNDASPKLNS